jgi:hypothetical protein
MFGEFSFTTAGMSRKNIGLSERFFSADVVCLLIAKSAMLLAFES